MLLRQLVLAGALIRFENHGTAAMQIKVVEAEWWFRERSTATVREESCFRLFDDASSSKASPSSQPISASQRSRHLGCWWRQEGLPVIWRWWLRRWWVALAPRLFHLLFFFLNKGINVFLHFSLKATCLQRKKCCTWDP